jgi:hypothetical protein
VGLLADLLRPAITAAADGGANLLIDDQAPILAALRSAGDQGIDFVASEINAALPHDSLGQRMARGEIQATVTNIATDLQGKLAAEDPVLLSAVEDALEKLSAAAAGGS